MIKRESLKILKELEQGYPIVAITGPRQSGKTTLTKMAFPKKAYVSLETPSNLEFAASDPKGFLKRYEDGAIIDEAQNAPFLFSYLQEIVDRNQVMGQFILTGSQQFSLLSGITQSLAGRVGLLELLPLSISEIEEKLEPLNDQLFKGFYPSLYHKVRQLNPKIWYEDYIKTYIERDVRKLINIKDLKVFRKFLRLCAARNAQILNVSELCSASDLNRKTVDSWLSILEASYILYFLSPHFKNFSKRIVKSPKLYFYDTGLVSHLLGLNSPDEVFLSSFKGAIFESMIISEVKKFNMNSRAGFDFYFWRNNKGIEIDLLFEKKSKICSVEIKSGETLQSNVLKNLKIFQKYASSEHGKSFLIYGGDEMQSRTCADVLPWRETYKLFALD